MGTRTVSQQTSSLLCALKIIYLQQLSRRTLHSYLYYLIHTFLRELVKVDISKYFHQF